jgi:ADP-heptose:LPS heptosyltransferase
LERFALLTEELSRGTGLTAVVLGGPAEGRLGNQLATTAGGRVLDLTGRTTMVEAAFIMSRAEFALCNESGSVHLAAATGVPSVCIVGGGHFGRFVPYDQGSAVVAPAAVFRQMDCYGCNWNCRYPFESGVVRCVWAVTVDDVRQATASILCSKVDGTGYDEHE